MPMWSSSNVHDNTVSSHATAPSPSLTKATTVADPFPQHRAVVTRPRTFVEKQPYIFAYGAVISVVSPAATAYQLCKLYNLQPSFSRLARLSAPIFPVQTCLKALQMNASTPVKEHLNPWAAFAVVGILQGGVYGQANVYFSRALQLGTVASMAGVFRGSAFAGVRDTISQGMPFMLSGAVRANVLDPVWETPEGSLVHSAKVWTSVLSTSVVATYLSQGCHNCQISMQADQSLSYAGAVQKVWKEHGTRLLYFTVARKRGLDFCWW